jgi:regulator of replication initiation timing
VRLGVVAEEAPREIVSPDGKAVSLSDYITFVAGAVKALAAEFDGLAASNTRLLAENDELRRQNAALASRLEALEHRLTAVERQERVAVVMTSAR